MSRGYLKSRIINSPIEPAFRWLRNTILERRAKLEVAEIALEERRLPIVLSRLLGRSSNIVDVGGHIGSFMSRALPFAPEGKHVIIEALPVKAKWLRQRFPKCRIETVAVSDKIDKAIFHEDRRQSGYSGLTDTLGPDCYEVRTTTLDALDLGEVHLLKLDIEGGELAALRGARHLVEDHRPALIFECGPEYVEGLDRQALFEFVTRELSYRVFTFTDFLHDKGPLSLDEFRKCGLYPFRAFNFVGVPNSTGPFHDRKFSGGTTD